MSRQIQDLITYADRMEKIPLTFWWNVKYAERLRKRVAHGLNRNQEMLASLEVDPRCHKKHPTKLTAFSEAYTEWARRAVPDPIDPDSPEWNEWELAGCPEERDPFRWRVAVILGHLIEIRKVWRYKRRCDDLGQDAIAARKMLRSFRQNQRDERTQRLTRLVLQNAPKVVLDDARALVSVAERDLGEPISYPEELAAYDEKHASL